MNSLRRWLYRPKRADSSLLAQFYFADEELNSIAAELDSFEARKDPERCTTLVNQLRACQARVLSIVFQMMEETVKDLRAPRDFRVKFPDDIIQENLAGQLWFGAECLAAGSSIMNREIESAAMRPLARALTKNLDRLRGVLREQCLRSVNDYTRLIKESLVIFDKLFAEFELSYVSAMVPVKTAHEYDMVQEITVLFSETVQRALCIGLLTQDTIDEYDPALMFTIPRLAIVSGVLMFKDGPLNPDGEPWQISEMFRPFQTLLIKIRDLLSILTPEELHTLESALCSQAEPSFLASLEKEKASDKKWGRVSERKPSEGDSASIGSSEISSLEVAERLLAQNFQAPHTAKTGAMDSTRIESSIASLSSRLSSDGSETSSFSSSVSDEESGEEATQHNDKVSGQTNEGKTAEAKSCFCAEEDRGRVYLENCDACTRSRASHSKTSNIPTSTSSQTSEELSNTAGSVVCSVPICALPACTSRNCPNNEAEPEASSVTHLCGLPDSKVCDSSYKAQEDTEEPTTCNLVKCDSMDSGLHSDLLSPSDSRNTISSTDFNLHSDVPLPSSPTHSHLRLDPPISPTDSHHSHPDTSPHSSIHPNSSRFNFDASSSALNQHSTVSGSNCAPSIDETQANQTTEPDCCSSSASGFENSNNDSRNCEMSDPHKSESSDKEFKLNCDCNCDRDSVNSDKSTEENSVHSQNSSSSKVTNSDPVSNSINCPQQNKLQSTKSSKSNRRLADCPLENQVATCSSSSQTDNKATTDINGNKNKRSDNCNTENVQVTVGQSTNRSNHPSSFVQGGMRRIKSKRQTGRGLSKASMRQRKNLGRSTKTTSDDCPSSETSSYTSDSGDREEIALAVEAAETASRSKVRSQFRSSNDMIHRLFVCISGVADQLQTNYAGDLRNILRAVFDMNCSYRPDISEENKDVDSTALGAAYRAIRANRRNRNGLPQEPPEWLPDEQTSECMSCQVPFTFVRRRHHCRNCGKIYCGRCSNNFVPLPHFGEDRHVRVCNRCFMFQVTHFTQRSPT